MQRFRNHNLNQERYPEILGTIAGIRKCGISGEPDQELAPGKTHGKGRPVRRESSSRTDTIMLRYLCALLLVSSALSAPRELADGHDVVNFDITSDKSTTGKGALPTSVAALCTFATSGSAQVFCH